MSDSYLFAVDVFRTICDRLVSKSAELQMLHQGGESFQGWLAAEAYLACRLRQSEKAWCEVAFRPSYASEGLPPDQTHGDLRVGGADEGAHHCWLFAEIVLIHEANRNDWPRSIEASRDRLLRLGWKKSAALIIVISTIDIDVSAALDRQPTLTETRRIPIEEGTSIQIVALDIKRNRGDILSSVS